MTPSSIFLDTAQTLQCEHCERIIGPEEPKLILGFSAPEGENWIMPYCAKCGEAFRDYGAANH